MKYDIKFPYAQVGESMGVVIWVGHVKACWQCGQPTHWVHTKLRQRICSTECEEAALKEEARNG